jgi:two-component system sensor histidine kinase KdpD
MSTGSISTGWMISPLSARRTLLGWFFALALPALAAMVSVTGRGVFGLPTDVMMFVLSVVVVALIGGLGPALLAAVASALLLNFFLTPPLYTFTIADNENVITLVVMVLVAVLVALVVNQAARRAEQASRARAEASLLGEFASIVLTNQEPLPLLMDRVWEAFGASSVTLLERRKAGWLPVASAGEDRVAVPDEADADVTIDTDVHLALVGRALSAGDQRMVRAAAGQALLALRTQRMAARALDAQRRAEATELRSALLSAVGHDLRTPLTSIKVAASGLRDPELTLSEGDITELLATIEESADRLQGLVDNLLDSARLATGAVVPNSARWAMTRCSRVRCRPWTVRTWSPRRSARRCPPCTPTPDCLNGSWPTSSTTRSATGTAARSWSGRRRRRTARRGYRSAITVLACQRTRSIRCSRHFSGSVIERPVRAWAWAWQWPAASPKPWVVGSVPNRHLAVA